LLAYADNLAKLGAAVRLLKAENPTCVVVVYLLVLTECRPGEIRCVGWRGVRADRVTLSEGRAGPGQVLLGEAT